MCFSLGWLAQLLIWIIVLGAAVMIFRLLLGWITSTFGVPMLGQVVEIILWAVIAVAVVIIVFTLLGCLLGSPMALLPHR